MANNFDSNFTRKLMDAFIPAFESERVLSANVNTQLFQGKFNGSTGDTIDVSRPTDYNTVRTATGDVSGETKSDIITGKASAVVQDYFTSFVDYDEADEAIKMGNIDQLLAPMATRMVTDFELDYAKFMKNNSGLLSGSVGTAIDAWSDIANAGATLDTTGVPKDGMWAAAINPFTQTALADVQRSLGAGGSAGGLVKSAHTRGVITDDFAGMRVLAANTLGTHTTGTGADRAGTLTAAPTATYVGAKDTMTQSLAVTAFQANLVVAAGEIVTVTAAAGAVNRLNLSTREQIVDASGGAILWTGTVTESVTLGASGEGTLVVTGPAIFESGGQYNTVSQAIASGDVITLAGAATTTYQPGLFWHRDAFTVTSVPIKRLHSTDTIFTTKDGLQFRVSKGVGFLENQQKVRIDFRPAYGVMNPFFAGQMYGIA
jgi:hypothetical protein